LASIEPAANFHILRHMHASTLALRSVPMLVNVHFDQKRTSVASLHFLGSFHQSFQQE